ncbi:MAG: glycosyltransferase [Candidatus Paceibacterota bacterium]
MDLLKLNMACHKYYNPGADYELIIVDNSSTDKKTQEYLTSLPNQVIKRENTGFSFGAYKNAWEVFGDKYDYYLFCEQDIVPTKDGWLQEIVSRFLSNKNIGAVGNVLEGYRDRKYFEQWSFFKPGLVGKYWEQEPWRQCNLDGAFMFTSSRILNECGLQVFYMKLVDPNEPESWDVTPGINELFWQHPILDRGYRLSSFDDGKHKYTNGICYMDWGILKDCEEYAPMIHGQTLYCMEEMKKYFSWYKDKNKFNISIQ